MERSVITAVGIDISKGKSMVAVRRPGGEVVLTPFLVEHTVEGMQSLTKTLRNESTVFLPFNMGNGESVTAGAGNPIFEDRYSVSYMWEDILTKDTIPDLISKFIFVEVKETVDEETGKVKRSENLIFLRYH